ncbi:ABC transporter permease [Anaeromicropila populeti]|uniref:NitT/TauT family transport system permease protein n=1 Tax=Anaeromicropila populeti TaxID=37658 RepID=A0A1I6JE53_9FIRM|nr:hypothetical protein [Anaeromicropila populeti]SFR77159.1 NitT/TauT family transport system permease protein [Anaeromicropila populeti]
MRTLSKRKLRLAAADTAMSLEQRQYVQEYLNRMKKIRFYQVAIFVVFVGVWEICTRVKIVDPFVFSSPGRVMEAVLEMAKDGRLFYHMGITLFETFLSFALVNLIGILVAVLLWWNENISKILEPYLVVLNSLPKSALAPVFIVWLGNNMKTIIIAAISVAFVKKVPL